MFSVEALKVGDRVGFSHSHMGSILDYGFGTISKIDKAGSITVACEPYHHGGPREPIKFTAKGVRWGKAYSRVRLVDPIEIEARVAEQNAERERFSKWRKANAIMEKYKRRKMDDGFRATLIALINEL